jgi:hypothetical protein
MPKDTITYLDKEYEEEMEIFLIVSELKKIDLHIEQIADKYQVAQQKVI